MESKPSLTKEKENSRVQVGQQPEMLPSLGNLPKEVFEDEISMTAEMNQLDTSVILSCMDLEGRKEIRTCPGDIYKIVNALMDYSRIMEMVIPEWGLEGYHRAIYELQVKKLREIAHKFSLGIGYDYPEAVKKCKKLQARQKKKGSSDVGEDALVLSWKRGQQ